MLPDMYVSHCFDSDALGVCIFIQTKEKAKKFEKFVNDNEVKRCRALKKYQVTREQNILKQREIEDLTEKLKKLQIR